MFGWREFAKIEGCDTNLRRSLHQEESKKLQEEGKKLIDTSQHYHDFLMNC